MLPLRDKIRTICHSLKMEALSGVEPSRIDDFRSRIKALPEAEEIGSMEHGELADLGNRAERLVFDIDNARNSRTRGFALRHMVNKGLPPRRAPLLAHPILPNWFKKAGYGAMEDSTFDTLQDVGIQGASKPGVDMPEGNFQSDPSAMSGDGCPNCGSTSFKSVPSDPHKKVCLKCGAPYSPQGATGYRRPAIKEVTDSATTMR